jgi:hypothetical protein
MIRDVQQRQYSQPDTAKHSISMLQSGESIILITHIPMDERGIAMRFYECEIAIQHCLF